MKTSDQVKSFLMTKNNPGTKSKYRRTLEMFLNYCYEVGLGFGDDIDFSKLIPVVTNDNVILYHMPVDHQLVEDFLMFRNWAGDSQFVLSKHLMHLKGFFQYLVDHKHLLSNPVELVQPIFRPVAKETPYLTMNECILLLASAANSNFPERDFAIVKTMFSGGLRPKELCELQVGDMDFVRSCIYICRWKKTGRIRIIPLYDQLYRDIQNYLNHDKRKSQNSKHLFLNNEKPFSQNELLELIKNLCRDAGITKPFTPKGFRHTMATLLFVNGLDIWAIKELLDHKEIRTTMIYTHGWASIPDDRRLTPNADLLSNFIRNNFSKIENPF
jgi:site-specific recombinase XerD